MGETYESAVALCVRVLAGALRDAEVSSEAPFERDPAAPYVQVSRTGGDETEFLDRPIITLMCWAGSDQGAYMLAEGCQATLREAALDDPWLSSCETLSLSRDQWTPAGSARYALQARLTINKP